MIEWLILFLIAGGLAAYVATSAQSVADWLRGRGLEKSWLMDAVVRLERVGNRVRRLVSVQGRRATMTEVVEETFDNLADLPAEIQERLRRQGTNVESILQHVQT